MTTYTSNYKLPKYELTDAPALDDQYNESMNIIDEQLKAAADSAAGWEAAVLNEAQLRTAADIELQKDIDDVSKKADEVSKNVSNVEADYKKVDAALKKAAGDAQKTADAAQKAADAAQKSADDAQKSADDAQKAADDALEKIDEEIENQYFKKGDKYIIPSGTMLFGFTTASNSEVYFEQVVLPKKMDKVSNVSFNNPKAQWRDLSDGSYINDSSGNKAINTMFSAKIAIKKELNAVQISGSSTGSFSNATNNGGCCLWLRENLELTFN